MRVVQLVTQPRGGPVDHAVDVACTLAAGGHDSQVVGPVSRYAPRLDRAGVTWHEVSMQTKTDLRGARRLSRTLDRLSADVLHCQDMRAGLVGRLLSRRQQVGTVVYTVHGVPDGLSGRVAGNAQVAPGRVRDRVYYLAGERLLARAAPAQLVVPCAAVGDYVERHLHQPAHRLHVVPNGVDPERFRPAAPHGRAGLAAVWLGVMNPVKRLDVLLRALAETPDVSLRLVGAGPTRGPVSRTVRELGLSARVTMCGFVDDPAPVFAGADVFVLPSAAEAFPLALLQAMASGLPVIASRVGGIPELVRDGVDGLLVPADDPAALAGALRTMAGDRQARAEMGRRARERVVAQFSLDTCVARLLHVYRGGAR
jgi:glycosyltransferase involved in cell wall biosynthesis